MKYLKGSLFNSIAYMFLKGVIDRVFKGVII